MTRQTIIARAGMSPARGELFDKIARGRTLPGDGHIGGPFDSWTLNPELGSRAVGLGNALRFKMSVNRRQIELVILVTGQFWQAQFEWFAHEPMARDAGLPEATISALKAGTRPDFADSTADAAAWALATELHNTRRLSGTTFSAAVEEFGEQGVAELIQLAGFYTMVSMTLNGFEVGLPAGAELPFPEGPPGTV